MAGRPAVASQSPCHCVLADQVGARARVHVFLRVHVFVCVRCAHELGALYHTPSRRARPTISWEFYHSQPSHRGGTLPSDGHNLRHLGPHFQPPSIDHGRYGGRPACSKACLQSRARSFEVRLRECVVIEGKLSQAVGAGRWVQRSVLRTVGGLDVVAGEWSCGDAELLAAG